MDNFVEIPFSYRNIDKYYVRRASFLSLKEIIDRLDGSLLDVGCGKMPYKKFILQNSKVIRYIGIDLIGGTEYDKDVKPDFLWDGEVIPFENSTFDCAIATSTLEHCPYPDKVLSEISRVLKPGGIFFFTVPFLWNLHEVPHDEYRFTPFSMERLLRSSGFSELRIRAEGGWHSSLAVMLGLWVRRSPLNKYFKFVLSIILMPIIWHLIKMDSKYPIDFMKRPMITGLSGHAMKDKASI